MRKKMWKVLGLIGACTVISVGTQKPVWADQIAVETSTSLYAMPYESLPVRESAKITGKVIAKAAEGGAYEVTESEDNGWIKIKTQNGEGYIEASLSALLEKNQEKATESARLREEVVDYALQFVGGPYVYGGVNPNTGVDCSGFTRYVMQHAAGISLSHSSRSQSGEGRRISYEEARPGDLVFYGKNGRINHVALYMGNGQVVHASTKKTGIVISNVMYRTPVKYVSVIN